MLLEMFILEFLVNDSGHKILWRNNGARTTSGRGYDGWRTRKDSRRVFLTRWREKNPQP